MPIIVESNAPTFVRTFDDFAPPATVTVPFTQAQIQEAPSVSGAPGTWVTLETKTVAAYDTASPPRMDFTTTLATLPAAWYRIVWVTADGATFPGDAVYFDTAAPAAAGTNLTTLAAVRAFLQTPATVTAQDALVQQLIARASAAVTRYCEREFTPTGTLTRSFSYDGSGRLDLAPYDLRTLTGFARGTDGGTFTAHTDVATLALRPTPPRDGVYRWIDLTWRYSGGSYSASYDGYGTTIMQVTGLWGFAAVPTDVEHATILTVADLLRTDVGILSVADQAGGETRFERSLGLSGKARGLLEPYKRIAAV